MLLLGLDFETTGVDPKTSEIIEMGWALYDTEEKQVLMMNSIISPPRKGIPAEITKLTGITERMCSMLGRIFEQFDISSGLHDYISFLSGYGELALVAHNADFELNFIKEHWPTSKLLKRPVLDTMKDIPYPDHIKHRDLERLSISHNCVNATYHRALPDVLTMFSILAKYDWDEVYAYWQSPLKTIRAVVGYDDNHKAKACGFQWSPQKKMWLKEVKACDYESLEKKALALALKVVEV